MLNLKRSIGLTAYGIAQNISGQTDPTTPQFKKTCQRWQRWLDDKGLSTLRLLEKDLERLGYRLTIEPVKPKGGSATR